MKRIGIILAMIASLFSLTPVWGQADSLCVSDANGFYHVDGWLGSTFTWDAQGNGVIIGQGNDSVSVAWTANPGTYTLSVFETSIDGCDGPIQYLTIEILPEPVVIIDIEICLGNTYTLPDGSVVSASGIYDVVLQSALGCDSTITTNLDVVPVLTNTVNAEICNGQSYTLPDGSTVTIAGSYDVTLTSIAGCDSIVTTVLDVVPVLTSTTNAEICNGQSYTLPDGTTVTTAGSYDVTLTSVAGCDSIVTTVLDVVPVLTNTVNAEICNGQSYTLPDGSTVTAAGSYDVTLTSVAGCDSIVTTTLDVVPVLTNTVNAEICNGQSYTLPDGSTVTAGGSYDVTLSSVAGCDSIVTTVLDVVPVLTNTLNAEICAGGSYTLPDGSSVNTAGSYDVTLTSVAGCDSIVTTILDVVPVLTSTTNAEICNGQSYTLPDGSTVTTGGSYDVTLTSVAGCDSIVTTILDVVPVLTNTVNAEICNGQSYTLPDGTTVTTAGSYDVTLTSVAGCDSIVTTILDIVPVLTSTTNAEICAGGSYTLPDGSTVTTAGSYDVTLTSVAGCDSIVTTTLDVVPVLTNTVNAEICNGQSYTLPDGSTVTAGGSYDVTLSSVAGCDSIVTTILDVVPVLSNTVNAEICAGGSYILPDGSTVTTAGSYDVTLTSVAGCDSIVTTILDVVPVLTSTTNAEICNGQSYTLPDGTTVTTAGSYDVTLTSVAGCDSIVTTILDVVPVLTNTVNAEICNGQSYTLPDGSTVTTGGSYDVTLTSVAGCDSIVTTILDVVPVITNTVNEEICNGQSYTLPDGSTVTTAGSYDVTLTSAAGCDSIVTTILDVVPVLTNTVNAEICAGGSYTLPDGSTVTTAGSYDVTLTSVAGCDSIVTTILDVVPVLTSTTNAEICNGQSYTLPNGTTVTTAGSYDVTLTSVAGCDSIVTTILDVVPVLTNTVNAEICNGQSYTLPDGTTVTTAGSYDVTLASVAGCDSIVTTIVDVVPVLTNTVNAEICNGQSYTLPDGSTVTTGGSYDVTLTSIAGCDSIVTTILDVVPVLTNSVNAEICNGQTYTLPDGTTVTTAGSYDVTLTSVAGCDSIVTTILDVVPVLTNTVNAEICAGGSYTLPDGTTVTTAGSYDVTLTSVAGCDSIVTTILDVVPVLTNTVNAEICNGQSYTLPDGSTVTTGGSYDVTLTSIAGCDSIVTTILDVVPVLTNSVNAEICNGQTYTLPDGTTVTTAGSYDVTLTSVAGCDSIVTTILDVVPVLTNTVNAEICAGGSYTLPDGTTVTTAGSYDVTLTSVAGCDSIVTTILDVVPVLTSTTNAEICNGQSYTLPDGSTVTTGGSYDVTLTSVAGCDSIVTTILDVVPVLTNTVNAEICAGGSYTLPDGSTVTTAGLYDVTLTSVAGCDSIVTTILDVVPVLTNTINAEICSGGSYTLPDGTTVTTAGSYDVTLTSVAGCDSIVTTILDVVPVLTNTVNAEICAGGSYTLPDGSTVTTGGSYDVALTSVAGCDSIVTTILDVVPVLTNTVNAEICNGQSYTLPNGTTVTTAGSYDVTLTAAAGCDSIVTTIVDVVPVLTNTVNAEICAGGSYTLPDGSTVNTAGSYDVTLTAAAGCDSIVTTILDVVPVLTNTVNAEICNGQSYTLPDGSTVTTAGSYDVTLTSAAGCDSIVTTILDVVPVLTNTVNAEICNGQSYTLPDGTTVTTAGSYDVTLASVAGCDSIVTTILNVVPVLTNSVNAEICNGQSYTLPDGSTVTTAGSYDVTLTSAAGCDSIVTTILDVIPVETSTVNAEICAGGSYTLPDGSTVTTAGLYDVTLTSVAGCDSIVTTILDVIPVETSTVNAEICAGGSYTLPDGSTAIAAGSYDVTLTSVAGCDSIVTTVLIVNPVYSITVNAQICNGQTYSLPDGSSVSASGSYNVTLSTVSGCDSIITTILDVVPVITSTTNVNICAGDSYVLPDGSSVNNAGSYPVILTSVSGCDSVVTTIVNVLPVYTILVNAEICSGNSYVLPDGVSVNASGSYTVTLNTIAGCDSIVVTELIVLPVFNTSVGAEICGNETYTLPDGSVVNTSGNYPVTLTATNGCDSTVITVLNVIPIFNINQSITICQGETYILPNGSSVATTGLYTSNLVSSLGCDSTIVTNLTVINVIPQIVNNTGTLVLTCNTPAISLTATGGLSYQWSNGLGNSSTVSISSPGTYSVLVIGPNGCSVSTSVIITQDITPPIASITNLTGDNELTCALTSISLQASGNGTYIWSGGLGSTAAVNVVSPGTYNVLVTATNGCTDTDSIEILQDIEEPAPTYLYYEVCQGESIQLQNGTTANTTGVYNVVLQAENGCDSLIVNDLIVHPTFATEVLVEICPDGVYTLPNGVEVSAEGIYPISYQTIFGCDSLVTFEIDHFPVYNITDVITICEGDNYELPDGVVTDVAGSYQFEYTSINGCDSIRVIQLQIQAPYVHTNHIQLCQGGSYTLPDGVVVNTPGYYPLVLQSFAGCDSTIITHITVTGLIQTFVTASFCSGSTYVLPDGVGVTTGGTYQSLLTSISGCDSLIFTTLTADSPVAMGIMPLGDTLSICYGDSIFLQAFGASSYNWVPSEGLNNPIGSANWVGPENSTTYVVNGANGACVASDSVYVEILPIPEVHIVADDIFVCEGDSILITVTGADTYEWSDNPLITCDTCQNFMIVPNGTITIEVTGDLEGCQATELLELGIMPNPVTIISGDSILCGEEITTLTALGATNYIWNTGDTTTTITVSPDDDEIFSVMGSLGNCVFADDILIEVYDYPEIDAGNDTLINMGDVVTLNPIGALSYSWYPDGTLSCLECEHPDAAPSVTTVYCVEGYNEFGCADTSCIKIEVTIDCPTFFIPNAFAPEEGGDEANNCFRIYGEDCFEEFVLRVYDRWGEVVFETTDSEKCWDGNFAGKEMNSGVFVYYLDAVLLSGEPFIRKGNVTLIR